MDCMIAENQRPSKHEHYPVKGSDDTMYTGIKVTQVCTKSIRKDTQLY